MPSRSLFSRVFYEQIYRWKMNGNWKILLPNGDGHKRGLVLPFVFEANTAADSLPNEDCIGPKRGIGQFAALNRERSGATLELIQLFVPWLRSRARR